MFTFAMKILMRNMIKPYIPRTMDLMKLPFETHLLSTDGSQSTVDSLINEAPHKQAVSFTTTKFDLNTNGRQSLNHPDFKAFRMLLCHSTNVLNLLP